MANYYKIERKLKFETEVVCQICGFTHSKTIQGHIRWQHPEIGIKEYMEKYDAEIVSENEKRYRAEKSKKANTGRKHSEEVKEKFKIIRKEQWTDEMKQKQAERMKKLGELGEHPSQNENFKKVARQNAIKRNKTEKQINAVKTALTGKKLSEEIKQKISDGHKGLIQSKTTIEKRSIVLRRLHSEGKMPLGHKRGTYFSTKMNCEFIYRSSYELKYFQMLDNNPEIKTWESECIKIRYKMEDGWHTYFPDVFVNGNEIHEIKPKLLLEDERVVAKKKAAEKFCEEMDWTYKIITEDELGIR